MRPRSSASHVVLGGDPSEHLIPIVVRKLSYSGPNGSNRTFGSRSRIDAWGGGPIDKPKADVQVIAESAGDIWFMSVPSVPGALASTAAHDQIEAIARVVIAQALNVPADSFDVDISSPVD